MLEALLIVIVPLIMSAVTGFIAYKKRHVIYEEISDRVFDDITARLQSEKNQAAIQSYLDLTADKVLLRFKGMMGGIESGISRNLKKLEGNVIQEGISAATGNPAIGIMAEKYLKKYPFLAMFLPTLMKGQFKLGGAASTPNPTSKLGKVG